MESNTASGSQPPLSNVPTKKGGKGKSRSPVWGHFQRIYDANGIQIQAQCIYCKKVYDGFRQSILTFQPLIASDSADSVVCEGVLGTWVFNQEAIRRALSEMIIIDELPFRFVERQGFRRFMLVCCPSFKIPSRWTIHRDKIIFYANILDPRDKTVFMPVQFQQLYGDLEGEIFLFKVLIKISVKEAKIRQWRTWKEEN